MFLQPKKIKFKKTKKGRLANLNFTKSNSLKFGTIGLRSLESGIITSRQLEAARQAIARKIKRSGKIWIRVFPDLPITAKPTAARMGKGKGKLSHWGARVRGGSIIFEICGVKKAVVLEAFRTGGAKLPVKTCAIE